MTLAHLEDEAEVFGINHGTGPEMSPRMQRHFTDFVRAYGMLAWIEMQRADPEQIALAERRRAALDAALASIDAKFAKPIQRKEAA